MKQLKKLAMPLLLVLVLMMLAAIPASAAAKTVATIGSKKYTSLNEALKKVTNGQTIKLRANVTSSKDIVINRGKKFYLDLNGNTISITKEDKAIRIENGSVAFQGGKVKVPDIYVAKGAGFTVKSGYYKANINVSGKAVFANGKFNSKITTAPSATLTIKKGTYYNTRKEFAYLIQLNGGKIVINGGTFKGTDPSMPMFGSRVMQSKSKLYIKGGTFTGKGSVVDASCHNTATIYGGTFKTENACCVGTQEYGKAIIKGGTFTTTNGYATIESLNSVSISGGTFKNLSPEGRTISAGTAVISGGTFTSRGNCVVESFDSLTLKGGTYKFTGKGAGHTIAVYGKMKMTGGKVYDVTDWCAMRVYSGAKAYLYGGTFNVSSKPIMAMGGGYVKLSDKVVINGLPKGESAIEW